jgi:hypothetical protein
VFHRRSPFKQFFQGQEAKFYIKEPQLSFSLKVFRCSSTFDYSDRLTLRAGLSFHGANVRLALVQLACAESHRSLGAA